MAADSPRRPGPVLGVLVADHVVRPLEHGVALDCRDPQELGDHPERQLGRQVGDEVGFASLDDPVDDLVGRLVDARLEVAHHARREALVHEPPVTSRQRRVHVQHHQVLLGDLLFGELEGHGAAQGRGEPLVVTIDRDALRIGGDRPEARPAGPAVRIGSCFAQVTRYSGHRRRSSASPRDRRGSLRSRPCRTPPLPLSDRLSDKTDRKLSSFQSQRLFGTLVRPPTCPCASRGRSCSGRRPAQRRTPGARSPATMRASVRLT